MSEPIDLELVKLRATVRGWYIAEHANRIVIAPVVMDTTGDILTYYRDGGTLVRDTGRNAIHALLTAPRWTLARLLSEPPEGWRVTQWRVTQEPSHCEHGPRTLRAVLCWGSESPLRDGEVIAEVTVWFDRREISVWCNVESSKERRKLVRLAERHKAAAELAYILAEIQP